MADFSLWEVMKRIESFNPQWTYKPGHHGNLSFETATADGVVSVLIEKNYSSIGSSSPISYEGFRLSIKQNHRVIFLGHYNVEYKSKWWNGGDPKPYYSEEYNYLNNFFKQFEAREQIRREQEAEMEKERKQAQELEIQHERNKFWGR